MTENDEQAASKTAKKKRMTALQAVGETLVKLKPARLQSIPLDDNLRTAIVQAQTMKNGNTLRRQLQYIGKLMRSTDHDTITQALARFEQTDKKQTYLLHQVENWRDRFIQQGQAALDEFLVKYPYSDRQQLRQLLREVTKEQQKVTEKPNLPPKYSRKLFKLLRDIVTTSQY